MSQKYSMYKVNYNVICEQYCRIRPELLLCDAERELLAIAKFLVYICDEK